MKIIGYFESIQCNAKMDKVLEETMSGCSVSTIKAVLMSIIIEDGEFVRHVPRRYLTDEMCFRAVRQRGESIRHLPRDMINERIRIEAVRNSMYAFYYIETRDLTRDICLELIRHDSTMIRHVPQSMI